MSTDINFQNFNYPKVYNVLMKILEQQYNIKIETQILNKEELWQEQL